MEENIPYRRLKALKPISVSHTSQKLLRPIFRNRSQDNKDKSIRNIMNQNVTQYHYMLADPHLKENYINWATNLRGYKKIQQKQYQPGEAPAVFFKQTLAEQYRKKQKNKNESTHINTGQYSQYFGKNSQIVPEDGLIFMESLRKFKLKDGKQNVPEELFDKYVKQTKVFPKILKKSAMKKTKNIEQKDFEKAFDGDHQFPQYTYKNLREKNSYLLQSLVARHSNVSLPGLAWSVGLRSY